MNIIDSLVVSLGFDTAGITKGAKDAKAATDKLSKDMVDAAGKAEKGQNEALDLIVKGLQNLGAMQKKAADENARHSKAMVSATEGVVQSGEKALRTFGALFLLFAGASSVKSFITDMLGVDAALGRTAKSIGQTPEALSGIGRAVERMGGTFSGAVGGLKGLSDAFEQMRTTGNSAILEPMARLQGLSGKAIHFGRDVHENFLSISEALKAEMAKDPVMADYLGRQILGDEGLVNLAKKGRAGVLAEEAKSPKITRQQTEDAQKLQEQLTAVRQGFQDIGNSILMTFGPAMVKAAEWVKDLVEKNRGLIESKVAEWVKDIGHWFTEHKTDIENFGKALGEIVTAAGTIATAYAKQSPAMMALEAFAILMGGRVLSAVTGVVSAMRVLSGLALPTWAGPLLGIPGAILAGGAAAGAMNAAHTDDYGRDAGTWGGDGPDNGPNGAYLRHRKAKTPHTALRRLYDWGKGKLGLGGDEQPKGGGDPELRAYIARAAAERGIDPRVALGVAEREGLNKYNGDKNTSFGPFQLHYKSDIPGFRNAGMGDDFTRDTGKDARDPSTVRAQVDYALDYAKKHGWKNWHGWKGDPRAGLGMDPAEAAKLIPGAPAAQATPPSPPSPAAAAGDPDKMIAGDLSGRANLSLGQLDQTKGFIVHHTAGRGTPEGVINTLNQGHLGVQYVMDREGKIFRTLPNGAKGQHILRSQINDLNNSNTQGMEVIAKDDSDVTPAQVAAGKAFLDAMTKKYPGLQVFGHGEVNPGHRPLTEGHSIVEAYRHGQAAPATDPNYKPPPVPLAQRTLSGYMGRETPPPASAPVTLGHAMHHVLKVLADSRRLTSHSDSHPVPVTMSDKIAGHIGKRTFGAYLDYSKKHVNEMPRAHAAALHRMTRMAEGGAYHHTIHNVNSSSDTKINGGIHVHTQATDARQIAADIEPHLHRGQAAGRVDYGLA